MGFVTRLAFRLLPAAALCSAVLAGTDAQSAEYTDSDWRAKVYENCKPPNAQAITQISQGNDRKLRFALAPGDVGGCSTDAKPRNGERFWERAEVKQRGTLARGKLHDIRFQASFQQGFTGKHETFFQVHGWSKSCKSAPLVMLRFNRGQMEAHVLKDRGNPFASNPSRGAKGALKQVLKDHGLKKRYTTKQLGSGAHDFRVAVDMRKKRARLSLWIDGHPVIDNTPLHIMSCAVPHVKLGIYRPGKRSKTPSVLVVDDLVIASGS